MYNIIKTVDLPDYLDFKSECQCGAHDLHVTIERDAEGGFVSLGFYDGVYLVNQLEDAPWYKRLWKRLRIAYKVLFHGQCEIEYEFVFKNREHVNEFVDFLNNSLAKMNEGLGDSKSEPEAHED